MTSLPSPPFTHAQDRKLRVLYDLSVMGAARVTNKSRTGVFRVVEQVAKYLLSRQDIDIHWTAYGNINHLDDVIEIAKTDPEFHRDVIAMPFARHTVETLSKPIRYLASTHAYPLVRPALPLIERLRRQTTFNSKLANGFDILHSPFNALPDLPSKRSLTRFLTVYDLIAIKFPHFFEPDACERFQHTINAIRSEDWVLCISEWTRNDLLNYRPDLDPEHVRVTPLAAANSFSRCHDAEQIEATKRTLGIPQQARYFLSVSTLEPRKNLRHLVSVFQQVHRELDDQTYLVLVGTKGWHIEEFLNDIAADTLGKIIVTGYVDDAQLAPLYSGAMAFVYPSIYEGFGLPPLEAMQCGTPVITSDNSSLPEVVGDAGILVPAESTERLANALIQLFHDADLRDRLSEKGIARAEKFTWQRCGELTAQAYNDAIKNR
ncbi:glycosyltransferase family 1 protein [Novipirellula rosea]|uniref:Glycosyl transferase family 1 domain-containing protein n=1 Tax=Novipirellula rosea TaxID=1031540 RepID=A0ABP8MJ91_9BACT